MKLARVGIGLPALSAPQMRGVAIGAGVVGAAVGGWAGKKVGWLAGAVGGGLLVGVLVWRYLKDQEQTTP